MDKAEAVKKLSELLGRFETCKRIEHDISLLCNEINKKTKTEKNDLEEYDLIHMNEFIVSTIGVAPKQPKKAFTDIVPFIYNSRKDVVEYNEYMKKRSEAIKEYYKEHMDERKTIVENQKKRIEDANKDINNRLDDLKDKLSREKQLIENDELLGNSLKNKEDIECIIEILKNSRADTLKEAVNLFFEDKHRKRMEEIAETQKSEVEKIRSYAQDAVNVAHDANDKMESIKWEIEEIRRKTDEACDKAEEAYEKANEAYVSIITNDKY